MRSLYMCPCIPSLHETCICVCICLPSALGSLYSASLCCRKRPYGAGWDAHRLRSRHSPSVGPCKRSLQVVCRPWPSPLRSLRSHFSNLKDHLQRTEWSAFEQSSAEVSLFVMLMLEISYGGSHAFSDGALLNHEAACNRLE